MPRSPVPRPSEVTGFPAERVLARSDFCVVTYDCDPDTTFTVPDAVKNDYPSPFGLEAMADLLIQRHDAMRPHLVPVLADFGLHLADVTEIRLQEIPEAGHAYVHALSDLPLMRFDPQGCFNAIATQFSDHNEHLDAERFDEEVEALLAHEETHAATQLRPAVVRATVDLSNYLDDVTAADAVTDWGTWPAAAQQRLNYSRIALSRQTFGREALSEGLAESVSVRTMRRGSAARGKVEPYRRLPRLVTTYDEGVEFVDRVIAAAGPTAVVAAQELPLRDRIKYPTEAEWRGGDLGAEAWLHRLRWLPDDYVPVMDRPANYQPPNRLPSAAPPSSPGAAVTSGRVAAAAQQDVSGPRRSGSRANQPGRRVGR